MVEAAPVAPVVEPAPVAFVVEAAPVAPVVEPAPVAFVVEAAPVAPVVEPAPVAPVVEAAPEAMVDEAAPVVEGKKKLLAARPQEAIAQAIAQPGGGQVLANYILPSPPPFFQNFLGQAPAPVPPQNQGDQANNLPVPDWDKCNICLDRLVRDRRFAASRRCAHVMCTDCARNFVGEVSCPFCRQRTRFGTKSSGPKLFKETMKISQTYVIIRTYIDLNMVKISSPYVSHVKN